MFEEYNEYLKSIKEEQLNGKVDDDSENKFVDEKKKEKQLVEEKKIEVQTGK